MTDLTLEQICGQLIVCGFSGTEVPGPLLARLEGGQCGGTIVFRRNLPDLDTALSLNEAVIRAAPPELPPFLGIDEEGGRVRRLPEPAAALPFPASRAAEGQAPGAPRTSFPAVFPPSIGKSPPVHDALASEARNTTR